MYRLSIILIVFIGILSSACFEDSDCITTNTNSVKVQFLTKDSLLLDPVTFVVKAESNDSILYDGSTALADYTLPLNPGAENAVFLFDDQRLEFAYEVKAVLDGLNCEAEKTYDMLQITGHTFDSVAIIQPQLDVDVETNVEIYR